ncbi:hypothetical protein DFR28_105144 [Arenicella xantha]|uniref:Uncharacterized protein n=1 Tax=Arenicella xantha TaxID=644221 RepID=A0A395JH87_9GAMM|nr:hypothetical protein DFR28_105144 [Arenicella xantha]
MRIKTMSDLGESVQHHYSLSLIIVDAKKFTAGKNPDVELGLRSIDTDIDFRLVHGLSYLMLVIRAWVLRTATHQGHIP